MDIIEDLKSIRLVKKISILSDEEVFKKKVALYKISTEVLLTDPIINDLIIENQAIISEIRPEFSIILLTASEVKVDKLYDALQPYGIIELSKSGYAAISLITKACDKK